MSTFIARSFAALACWSFFLALPGIAEEAPTDNGSSNKFPARAIEEASLSKTIAFDGFVANEVYPADLDNDGRLELLCLQSPGIYQSQIFSGTPYETPLEQREIFCLTAITLDGKVLWQFGKPNLKFRQANSHAADQTLWCGLIDHPTKPEIALVTRDALLVLDAATGKTKRSTPLREDNYGIVRCFRARNGNRLLVQNTESSYSPYQYASPALIYDAASLKRIAIVEEPLGSGHSPRIVDIDNDGIDEFILGYEAYDCEGHRLWQLTNLGEVNPRKHHVDQLQIGRIGESKTGCVVYAGSYYALMGTLEGKLLWKQGFGHPQHVVIGDFRQGDKRACIALYCCRDLLGAAQEAYLQANAIPLPPMGNRNNIAFLNAEGDIINLIFPPRLKYHSGEGILLYPQGCPDGGDAVITRDWEWPEVFDLAGTRPFAFSRPVKKTMSNESGPAGPGPDGYGVRIADFDQDGRAEVLIHDQTDAWIYKPPYPKPGAPNTHKVLEPVTGQGNYGMNR